MAMLICDFHIHTTWSDGSVDLPEVVDIYGQAGFDVISITDHVYNSDSTIGLWADRLNKTIAEENFPRYMEALEREAKRARTRYGMLLIPGVEITKDYLSEEKSAHVLLLDLRRYLSADTLYFWNHRQKYASYFDAWEVANRTDLFSVVSLGNYPILANGDFHKANHLYSWKTLLPCLKNVEAVKECIRDNRGVAITMFRNGTARE